MHRSSLIASPIVTRSCSRKINNPMARPRGCLIFPQDIPVSNHKSEMKKNKDLTSASTAFSILDLSLPVLRYLTLVMRYQLHPTTIEVILRKNKEKKFLILDLTPILLLILDLTPILLDSRPDTYFVTTILCLFSKKRIMKITTKAIIATVLLVGFVNTANASCRKSQVCDDYGNNCRAQDICDSTLDLPSVELAPLRPLPSTDLKPLPSMELPPLGTSQCQYMQVNGHWQNVCR